MKTYHYTGTSAGGAEVDGILEAFDQKDAIVKAREHCRILQSVEPVRAAGVKGLLNADIGDLIGGGKIKAKKLSVICSQLSIELRAGLPLVRALEVSAANEEDKKVKKLLEEVADDVHSGNPLAESFELRGPFLPKTFIETVRAGEASGQLDDCFDHLKQYYEDNAAVSSKVKSAMIYPVMLIVVAIVVVAIIMIKAVPVFENSFTSLGNELPGVTRALIGASHFFTDYYLLIVALVALIVLALKIYGRTDKGKHFFGRLALTFPGIGLVNRMNAACQFSSTMDIMLTAGMPLVQATRITAAVVDNILVSEDLEKAVTGVIEGNRLGDGLKESKWLPGMLLEMTAVGEETGNMQDTLQVVNKYYSKEVNAAVTTALGILEPVIIIVMAALVVFILLSVYLPLFSMYGSV